jgi:hypothetical protein
VNDRGVRPKRFVIKNSLCYCYFITTMSDAVHFTCIVSTYMQQKFPLVLLRTRLESPDIEIDEVPHPQGWSMEFALEVDLALDVIARAFHHQGNYITPIY